jgi:polyisoprenoid-binding protein YceI
VPPAPIPAVPPRHETKDIDMRRLLLAVAALAAFAAPAWAETYHLDPGHTDVRFFWNHAGVSEQSGRWDGVSGTADFSKDALGDTKISVTIKADSINTGVTPLDEHLKNADFFEVSAHPEITFTSTGAVQTGPMNLQITGDLTIKGVTKPVTLNAELVHEGKHPLGAFIPYYEGEWLGVKATGDILRSDFGLGMFAPLTSDHIRIVINTEMRAGGWPE